MKSLATTQWTSIMRHTLNRWRAVKDGIFPPNDAQILVRVEAEGIGRFYESEYYIGTFFHPYYGQDVIGEWKGVTHWCFLKDLNYDFSAD